MRLTMLLLLGLSGCISANQSHSDASSGSPSDMGQRAPYDLGSAPSSDGAQTSGDDLRWSPGDFGAAVDLSAPPDFGLLRDGGASLGDLGLPGFCDGTVVAGTCLQAFFAPVAVCFQPIGACVENKTKTGGQTCWPGTNAKLEATFSDTGTSAVWSGLSADCMDGTVGMDANGLAPLFTLHRNGETLVYDAATGDVTCPDGTTLNIGADHGSCAALKQLLDPSTVNCAVGACP